MENLWVIISSIPWWVYVLFIILVKLGIRATKPNTIAFQRLFIFPLIFFIWSGIRLYTHVELGYPSLIIWWILSMGAGAYLGIREVRYWKIHVDKHKHTITVPGNYSTIVLVLAIFILNFFWGYYLATSPSLPYWVLVIDIITTTILSGFFVGRGCLFLWRYFHH